MADLPRGTVTFLFTDIEGSTRLWRDHRAEMEQAYARHDALLRDAITAHRGVVYKVIGDALQVAFPSAPEAVAAALEAQFALDLEPWPLPAPLRVRMALHAGEVDPDPDGDYRSPVLNRLGRLLGVGHGEQVLLSHAVRGLSHERLPDDAGLLDLGEHRLKDLLEQEHLYQLIHPGLPSDFPPLATLDRRPHNLPLQPTLFLGREAEVARVTERLRDPSVRLLTLTGPGGTGKTRLALQAAAEMVEAFADGVWFVGLAPLSDPALIPAAIAAALGVREEGGRSLQEALSDFLREKRLLLVLDNFEQVLAAASVVGALLPAAPGLTVLVTSRSPLRLRGEREHPVPPLGLPRRKPPPTLEQLGQYEAVRLFIARAQEIRPDFAITNESAPAVAELCWRLDGLPLAIELAAARVRMLSPQMMLSRLEQRLPLLTGGARDAPARQQTLRGAIAWSYDLLEPDEQKLYRRLSVFAGGWTLEAAEAVAGSITNGELELDVLEGMERLVQHSLVRQEEGLAGECRYQMLETIREYGLDRLEESGEAEEAHQRHAVFFLKLAETAEPALRGPDQGAWFDRLEAEHDNFRTALAWALAHDPETAFGLSAVLWLFWNVRGHLSEGRLWTERVLALKGDVAPTARVLVLEGASVLAVNQGDLVRSQMFAEQSLALAREIGFRKGEMLALSDLGLITYHQGDVAEGRALLEAAIAVARDLGVRWVVAAGLNNLGYMAMQQGDLSRARALLEEAVAVTREIGDAHGLYVTIGSLGEVASVENDRPQAIAAYREALTLAQELGNTIFVAAILRSIAAMVDPGGAEVQAVRLFGAAETLRESAGASFAAFEGIPHDPTLAALRERVDAATFTVAWEAGRALSLAEAVAEALALADDLTQVPTNV